MKYICMYIQQNFAILRPSEMYRHRYILYENLAALLEAEDPCLILPGYQHICNVP
jgi:hypothetical protein